MDHKSTFSKNISYHFPLPVGIKTTVCSAFYG